MTHSPIVLRRAFTIVALSLAVLFAMASPAAAQVLPEPAFVANLSGPRFGITLLSPGIVDKLAERHITVRPYITQFGWQFEKQFFSRDSGVTMVTEWVALIGGI